MASWDDIVRSVTTRYPDARHEGRVIHVVLARRERRIAVTVRSHVAYRKQVAVVSANLGQLGRLDPWIGLQLNTQLAHGALAIEGNALVLRACIQLDELALEELDVILRSIAAEAVELDPHLAPRATSTTVFNHYIE